MNIVFNLEDDTLAFFTGQMLILIIHILSQRIEQAPSPPPVLVSCGKYNCFYGKEIRWLLISYLTEI